MRLSSIGKCVDQPLILNKLEKKMPALLIGAEVHTGFLIHTGRPNTKIARKKQKLR